MDKVAGTRRLIVQTRSRLCGVDPESGAELWSVVNPSFRDINILTPMMIGDRIFATIDSAASIPPPENR